MSNLVTSKAALIGYYESSLSVHLDIIQNIENDLNDKEYVRFAIAHLKKEVEKSLKNGKQYWNEVKIK